jgi:hypothetical protein
LIDVNKKSVPARRRTVLDSLVRIGRIRTVRWHLAGNMNVISSLKKGKACHAPIRQNTH